MTKYKVTIRREEKYSYRVIVDAENPQHAKEAVEKKWDKDDKLYERVTEYADDTITTTSEGEEAKEEDINIFPELEK